ncbi:ABC transporter ATP-binding protein [Wohlfahrtiimonas populi]|uniref:ABC transporter ATP-binding protein n=1 Tax=Wohlfahrtiimonas populi TaxID=1940240 RepID=UPI00098D1612|nr:sn-glycerol-3-phosphate ABC transporter ATP-binding protein UgpC [Wohlfahrtiimonas populi]
MATVQLKNITKHYGSARKPGPLILKGIDIDIKDGEFIVVVGPSGCGKSTLLRVIAGLETSSGGEIHIGDKDVTKLEPAQRDIAMVFQNYALYPHMSVRENMAYGVKLAKMPKDEIERRIQDTAKMLDIEQHLDKKPNQLSGGQRQRVAMGRAIVRKPKLFLFDEPLSNLDAKLRTSTRLEIRRRHNEIGITSLYVTHDQTEAMTLADRIIIMNGGVVEQFGTPSEIFHSPASTFVANFMGSPAMNLLNVVVRDGKTWLGETELKGITLPETIRNSAQKEWILGIRPEHIVIVSESTDNSWDVTLSLAETLGSEQLLYTNLGKISLTIRTEDSRYSENKYQRNQTFHIEPKLEEVLWFDAITQKRI